MKLPMLCFTQPSCLIIVSNWLFQVVVRDLWALRLESLSERLRDPAEDDREPELFSSQPATTLDEPEGAFKLSGRAAQWPRLIDTIGLCYLGCLLMRLPVTIGDFHR